MKNDSATKKFFWFYFSKLTFDYHVFLVGSFQDGPNRIGVPEI